MLQTIAESPDATAGERLRALDELAALGEAETAFTTADRTRQAEEALAADEERLKKAVALFGEHFIPSTKVFEEAVERRALELIEERAQATSTSRARPSARRRSPRMQVVGHDQYQEPVPSCRFVARGATRPVPEPVGETP